MNNPNQPTHIPPHPVLPESINTLEQPWEATPSTEDIKMKDTESPNGQRNTAQVIDVKET